MNKNLIYTCSSGAIHAVYAMMANPLIEHYAEQCGADFKYEVLDTDKPFFGKYRAKDLLNDYERILYVDCDILVRPDSPNLFDLVPEDSFAAFMEGAWCWPRELELRFEVVEEAARILDCSTEGFDMARQYFNCGVFVASRRHQYLFEQPDSEDPAMKANTVEQAMISLRLYHHKENTYFLPICFNAMPWRWTNSYRQENYFLHYAGMPIDDRYKIMNADWRGIMEKFGTKDDATT